MSKFFKPQEESIATVQRLQDEAAAKEEEAHNAQELQSIAAAIVAPRQPENQVARVADSVLDKLLLLQSTIDEAQTEIRNRSQEFLMACAVGRQQLESNKE